MRITDEEFDNLFEFQKNKPLIISEDIVEDMAFLLQTMKSKITISDGAELFKYFIEKSGKYTLYYINGFENLKNEIGIVSLNSYTFYNNGGIPVFVEK